MTQGSVRYNSIYVYIGIVGGLLVLCFTVSLAAQQTDEEQSAHYARGSRAMQLGLYDEAVNAFQQVLQLNPQNAEAHCELGAVYRFKEKTNDSIDTYLRALELPAAPQTHGVAHLCLARIYHSQGRFMDAEKHGQHAVDLLPKIAEPFFRLADTYIQKCQWRCTMQEYYGIGEVFVKVANLERAAAFYRDSLGFEVVERNNRQLYIYLETGHLVLKEAGSPGHDAGGPMHFAFVTSTQRIEQLVEQFASLPYRTRGPFDFDDPRGKCRAFFIFDPDGNEIEFNDLYYPDNSL